MNTTRKMTLVAMLVVLFVGDARAADQPLSGAKLTLRRSASGTESMVFVVKDPAFLFPAIGSADDPATGAPGGASFELFSSAQHLGAGFDMPAGVGEPGWRAQDAARDAYTYRNPIGTLGPTWVRMATLKQGRLIKIVASGTGLAVGPKGTVVARLTMGTLRNCALFDAPTIHRDDDDRFVASGTVATSLTDCSSVLPPTTTSTTLPEVVRDPCAGGSGYPTCDGTCPAGYACGATLDFTRPDTQSCLCYPIGVTPCGASTHPTCGGECSGIDVCQAFEDVASGAGLCACVDPTAAPCGVPGFPSACTPGACPPGQACRVTTVGPMLFCSCG